MTERTGPLLYNVLLDSGECWKRHTEHLREVVVPSTDGKETTDVSVTTSSNTSDPMTEVI